MEIEFENGDAKAVKIDEVVIETDDVGVKIEADLQENGKVEIQALGGADEQAKIEPALD